VGSRQGAQESVHSEILINSLLISVLGKRPDHTTCGAMVSSHRTATQTSERWAVAFDIRDQVKKLVDSFVGPYSNNEYFEMTVHGL
jgi:hypothetical protein